MSRAAALEVKEEKHIQAIADKLKKKYSTKRKINEKPLNKSTLSRVVSLILSCFCCLLALFVIVFCIASFNATLQKVVPSFAGFSTMRVSSGSMVNSGFNIGDTIVVKTVDTHTLKPNDVIAFYTYSKSYYNVTTKDMVYVPADEIDELKTSVGFRDFLGLKNSNMQEAGKSGSMLVLHHIRAVYQDINGKRWFTTYGSSNASDDPWLISEDYVVGINDNSAAGKGMAKMINFASMPIGKLTLIIVPLAIIGFVLVKQLMHDIQIAKLQLDVVEEKRKLTDQICVKNQVGYSMDKKTKYKVLAQASPENFNEYMTLLWEKGSTPNNARKYYIRKKFLINSDIELRDLNRTCEEMFARGEDPQKIAKFYDTRKKEITKKLEEKHRKLKAIREKYKKNSEA